MAQYRTDQLSFQALAAYDEVNVGTDTAKQYYVWQPAGSPVTINLDLAVVDKLHTEVMRGFGAVRRRGTEVGGILLGHLEEADSTVTLTVEDVQPVVCEYAFGPSYILSPEDMQRFRKALAEFDPSSGKQLYTVGFYRSHTRDGLSPDEHDARFFREYFPDPLHVVLLVKPFATKAPQAGFFVQQDGVLKATPSPMEFPFRRRELTGGAEIAADRDRRHGGHAHANGGAVGAAHTDAPQAAAERDLKQPDEEVASSEPATRVIYERPMFAESVPAPSPWKTRLSWFAMCTMLVVFGVVIGMFYTGAPPATSAVASAVDAYALNLSVSRVDNNLLVKWDPQSFAVRGGWKGVLTITEGTDSKAVEMEPTKLQNGSVLYRHVASHVDFRLEVFVKEHRSVVETVAFNLPDATAADASNTRD